MRIRTLARLAWVAALSSAAGCAVRAGQTAPEPISWDPVPGTPARTTTAARVAADAPPPAVTPAGAVARAARAARSPLRVYVIDGVDPLGFANTRGLADRLRGAGFPDTRYAGWLRAGKVEQEIRAAHAADPAARFAVVGYSAGVYPARNLVNRLTRDGVPVAVVGYVGGDYLSDSAATRAGGVGRVVNVTGNGHPLTGRNLLFNGTDVTGARNMRLGGTGHYGLPGHPDTFTALEAELTAAAGE